MLMFIVSKTNKLSLTASSYQTLIIEIILTILTIHFILTQLIAQTDNIAFKHCEHFTFSTTPIT
jgi:hypothetical protein